MHSSCKGNTPAPISLSKVPAVTEESASSFKYLEDNYTPQIALKGGQVDLSDIGDGFDKLEIMIEPNREGKTFLMCMESESFDSSESIAVRFTFEKLRTTLVANPKISLVEHRERNGISSSGFFEGNTFCAEANSDSTRSLRSFSIYPSIGYLKDFPFYSTDAAGSIQVIKYIVVALP